MQVTPELEKLISNHEKLVKLVSDHVKSSPEKNKALLLCLDYNKEELVLAPASTRREYHGAFPGGLVEHLLRVLKNLSLLNKTYETKLTHEEMVVTSFFHDIGKLGDDTNPYYIKKDSEWHNSHGIFYEVNPAFTAVKVSQLSLYNLQQSGAKLSLNEYMAISNFDRTERDPNLPAGLESNLSILLRQAIGFACHQGRNKDKVTL